MHLVVGTGSLVWAEGGSKALFSRMTREERGRFWGVQDSGQMITRRDWL